MQTVPGLLASLWFAVCCYTPTPACTTHIVNVMYGFLGMLCVLKDRGWSAWVPLLPLGTPAPTTMTNTHSARFDVAVLQMHSMNASVASEDAGTCCSRLQRCSPLGR